MDQAYWSEILWLFRLFFLGRDKQLGEISNEPGTMDVCVMKSGHLSNLQFLKQHFHSTLACSTSTLLLMLITCLFFYPSDVQVLILLVWHIFMSHEPCIYKYLKSGYLLAIVVIELTLLFV
jgi:hypothetical protein